MRKLEMTIDGMHCEACVAKIQDALKAVSGVDHADVQLGSAVVTFDETQCTSKPLLDAVRASGFGLRGFKTMRTADERG